MGEQLERVVDVICLVYHEARNLRHPVKAGKLQTDPRYGRLLSLPVSRDAAWVAMSSHRKRAALAGSAKGAVQAFEAAFGLSLDELHQLYLREFWKGSSYGGNRWAPITERVGDLVAMADAAGDEAVVAMLDGIHAMCHNTGKVGDKLRDLKECCDGE